MNRIVQATSRGQVTLPKVWRDQFDTSYYSVELQGEKLVFSPLKQEKTFEQTVENAWQEYQNGEVVGGGELMKKYGL